MTLEVRLTGSAIEILVDGKSVLKYDDGKQALAAGTIGLRPWHREVGHRNLWVKTGEQIAEQYGALFKEVLSGAYEGPRGYARLPKQ